MSRADVTSEHEIEKLIEVAERKRKAHRMPLADAAAHDAIATEVAEDEEQDPARPAKRKPARTLESLGAKCVILTAGPLGGLIVYRQKATTYPALPVETTDGTGVGAAFAGALAAWLTGAGKDDFRAIKRGCAVASGVAGICAQGIGPKKLLGADRKEYLERFNRLRRAAKG